jgi:D-threo-aldose 1-dehydrogenase
VPTESSRSKVRQLGSSGIAVTSLGLGGGPAGRQRGPVADKAAAETVRAAWAAGIRYFDTAPLYGLGRSETRIGAVLRQRPRGEFVLSTKVGRLLRHQSSSNVATTDVDSDEPEVVYDYSRDGALRSLEESFRRLGLERADIVLIHDVDRWTHGDRQPEVFAAALDGAYRALADLKAEGVVRAIGIGVNEWQVCRDFALRAPIDCVLLAGRYTLLEQEAGREFLPFCRERGLGVIIGGPFNSGILVTGPVEDAQYNYAPAPPALRERVGRIKTIVEAHGVSLAAAALAFPLRHAAVAAVIPGLMSVDEVAWADKCAATPIPQAVWDALASVGLVEI